MYSFYEISISKNGEPLGMARLCYFSDHLAKFSLIMNTLKGLSSESAEAIEICITSDNARDLFGGIKVGIDLYNWKLVRLWR